MSAYYGFPEYVSVDEKKARHARMAQKLARKNPNLHPIVLEGRTIAKTFWGKAWCRHIESFSDYDNRLPRGRSYLRTNAVLDLQIAPGKVSALVAGSGSSPYEIKISFAPLSRERWEKVKSRTKGRISSLLALLQGRLPKEVIMDLCDVNTGLFPDMREVKSDCSCPDYSRLCKHLAAVLYGIASRLDEDPTLFFTLRGVNGSELVEEVTVIPERNAGESQISKDSISAIFGEEFDTLPENPELAGLKPASEKEKAEKAKPSGRRKARKDKKAENENKSPKAGDDKSKVWTTVAVKALRARLGLSKTALAQSLGLTPQTILRWEKIEAELPAKYWKRLNALEK